MSKALEAAPLRDKLAKAIHPDAFGALGAIRPDAIAVAYDAADRVLSVLAHLAEDEVVVVAVGRAANQAWHVWLAESRITSSQADVAQKTPAHAAGIAALKSLAGKE